MASERSCYNRIKTAAVDFACSLIQETGETLNPYRNYLTVIGLLYCGKLACAASSQIYEAIKVHLLSRVWSTDLTQYGQWALVTGCTDGIGKEYARNLARRGLNIVLLDRDRQILEATANQLEHDYKVRTSIVCADLSQGHEIYPTIASQLEGFEIGILVNSAGVMYDQPSKFCNLPKKKLAELVNVNMMAVMMITYIVLPQMLSRKSGVIVNLSSMSAMCPSPLMAVYSASKVFVDWFSVALDEEYRSQGIIVQSLIPSYVSINPSLRFSNILSLAPFIVPDAKCFVNSAVDTIGYSKRTTGFWSHGLQYWAIEHVPQWLWNINLNLMVKTAESRKIRSIDKITQ